MARIVAVANQKGGVGKTTTAINLSASLAATGQRVLLVDIDPQGNLTSGVGQKGKAAADGTIYDALVSHDHPPVDAHRFIIPTGVERLHLIPADRNLTGAEIELVTMGAREERLRALLTPVRAQFDYVYVDCPPSLGLLTLNALVAADAVLVPLHCEYFALEGLADLVSTMRRVRAAFNPLLDVEGVLLTMFDERTNLGQQVATEVREFFKEKVFRTVIPRNVRLGEAPSHGMPVILYDPKSRGAEAYTALAREVLQRAAASAA
jgi:chromosome partitioning protein